MTNIITQNDKIVTLLKKYPQFKKALIQRSPKFKRLNNPILFNTVARMATISDAARIAGEDLDEFLTFLNSTLKLTEENMIQKTSNTPDTTDILQQILPNWLADMDFETADAREMQGAFLPEIIQQAKGISLGKGLKVIQNFEPVPLYSVMNDMGWAHITRQITSNEFHVFFYRKAPAVETNAIEASVGERVPVVLQSATPIVYPLILRLQQSEALMERVEFIEVKVWEQTEKHLGWIASGKADISFSAVMAMSKMLGGKGGIKLASVDVWDNFYLLSRDPQAVSFADLRGETIAMPLVKNAPPGKVTEYLMRATVEDPADFNFVFGKQGDPFGRPEEIIQKLVSGEVDAALLREPEVSYALTLNDELRVAISYGKMWRSLHPGSIGLPNAGMVFKKAFLQAHPDIAQLFLAELSKAMDWVNSHQNEAAEMSCQAMGHSLAEVKHFLSRAHFKHVMACDAHAELQSYLNVLDKRGKLKLKPEDCDFDF